MTPGDHNPSDHGVLDAVALRQYVEALFAENQRATEIAEREREKAAAALHAEQQRAADVAERERTKAAEALATWLARSISEGDDRLREHITNQVQQIEAALTAAEVLSYERISRLESESGSVDRQAATRVAALNDLVQQKFDSTREAVSKAEAANERRFESVNAFRAQLGDQVAQFLPREVSDAQFNELRKAIGTNTTRLDQQAGKQVGSTATYGAMLAAASLIVTIVVLIANHTFG